MYACVSSLPGWLESVKFVDRFADRIAMVTGGGHGIGRATALRLASEGATVVVADIDVDAAGDVVADLVASGKHANVVACDILEKASVELAMRAVEDLHGRLDVLINTAGGAISSDPLEAGDEDGWHADLELNLIGTMRVIQRSIPLLRKAAPGAAVVSIGSVNGLAAFGGYSYSAAKVGLELVTRNLALDYAAEGIRFNLIAPGTIDTRVWDNQPGARERLGRLYPLGRIGLPEDIAAAAAFLASDDAAWITGITLPVEGGILTGPNATRVHDSLGE